MDRSRRPRFVPLGLASPRTPLSHGSAAFSLIELLVTIALVAVLVGLLLPSLSGVRRRGEDARSLANMRGHAAILNAYTSDWREMWPSPLHPDALTVIRNEGRGLVLEVEHYFFTHTIWNYALADMYYDGDPFHESFYPPRYPLGMGAATVRGGVTPYHYACVFIAAPGYWRPETRTGSQQWSPTFAHQVTFPSLKSLLVSFYPLAADLEIGRRSGGPLSTAAAAVDGSAAVWRLNLLLPGYPSGDGLQPHGMHAGDFPPAMHTLGGVSGRDRQ